MSTNPFEKLEKASKEEIVNKINSHLKEAESTINDLRKPHHVLQAQLLIQELTAREQRRQTEIMVLCTIIITVLTAIITWATVFK